MRHRHAWTRWGFVLASGQRLEPSSSHRHAPSRCQNSPPRFVFLRLAGAGVHRPCPSNPKGARGSSTTKTQPPANIQSVPKGSMDGRRWGGRSQKMAGHWMRVSPACLLMGPPGMGKSLGQGSPCLHRRRRKGALSRPASSRRRGRLGWGHRRGRQCRAPGPWQTVDCLFLDELTEWPRNARESLRHVMETGVLHLHRADGSVLGRPCGLWLPPTLHVRMGQDRGCV